MPSPHRRLAPINLYPAVLSSDVHSEKLLFIHLFLPTCIVSSPIAFDVYFLPSHFKAKKIKGLRIIQPACLTKSVTDPFKRLQPVVACIGNRGATGHPLSIYIRGGHPIEKLIFKDCWGGGIKIEDMSGIDGEYSCSVI